MLVRGKASHSPRPSVRDARTQPNNGELAPLYRVNDSCCASLFYRLPSGGSDLEANDLDRLGAGLHGLAFCSRKSGGHEAGDHVAIEPVSAHKQRLGSTMRAAGE